MLAGDLTSGTIRVNDSLHFKLGDEICILKIGGIGNIDNIHEQIFKIGLLLKYENEAERQRWKDVKIPAQTAVVLAEGIDDSAEVRQRGWWAKMKMWFSKNKGLGTSQASINNIFV